MEEIGLDRQIHTPTTYLKNNCLLQQFLWTYWSKQWVSIDKFAYLSKVSIGIDMQCPNLLTFNRYGLFNSLLSRGCVSTGLPESYDMKLCTSRSTESYQYTIFVPVSVESGGSAREKKTGIYKKRVATIQSVVLTSDVFPFFCVLTTISQV